MRNSTGVLSRTLAALLVGFFALNPFLDVYADELPLLPIEVPAVPVIVSTPQELTTATSSPENIIPPADTEASLSTTTENILPPLLEASTTNSTLPISDSPPPTPPTPTETTSPITPPATTTSEVVVPQTEFVEIAPTPEPIADTSPEGADMNTNTPDTQATEENTSTPDVVVLVPEEVKTDEAKPEPVKTEAPREPEKAAEQTPPASIINVIEHKYLFRENECTRLDDGAFYCLPPETASTTSVSNTSLPRVIVEKNGGNKEIFFEDINGKKKITDNDFDDDAPAYDKNSNLIVWHSLIKGRMQIMLYDRNSGTIKQLTDTPYNNTDPKIHGKSVVWQGWVNNNWEIFYGNIAVEPFLAQQITTNDQPDMFPMVSDGFITWQSFLGGSWRVFVYNLDNGQTSQISQPEAGKYENPRFALLFENRKENGEVETVGYDVASGKEIPINAPGTKPVSQTPAPQDEKDKAVPVPASGGTASTSAPLKNPGKDDEGGDGN